MRSKYQSLLSFVLLFALVFSSLPFGIGRISAEGEPGDKPIVDPASKPYPAPLSLDLVDSETEELIEDGIFHFVLSNPNVPDYEVNLESSDPYFITIDLRDLLYGDDGYTLPYIDESIDSILAEAFPDIEDPKDRIAEFKRLGCIDVNGDIWILPGTYTLTQKETVNGKYQLKEDSFTLTVPQTSFQMVWSDEDEAYIIEDWPGDAYPMDDDGYRCCHIKIPLQKRESKLAGYTALKLRHQGDPEGKINITQDVFELYKGEPNTSGSEIKLAELRPNGEGNIIFGDEMTKAELEDAYFDATSEGNTLTEGCFWTYGYDNFLLPGKYYLKLKSSDASYHQKPEEPWKFEVLAPSFGEDEYAIRQDVDLTLNTLFPVPLNLKKTDAKRPNSGLAGAKFTLSNSDKVAIKSDLTTGDDGVVVVARAATAEEYCTMYASLRSAERSQHYWVKGDDVYLLPGTYYLKENTAPDQYEINENEIEVTLDKTEPNIDPAKIKTVEVTNKRAMPTVVKLTLKDEFHTGKSLAGAEFSLYKVVDGQEKELKTGLKADDKGVLFLGELKTRDEFLTMMAQDSVQETLKQGYFEQDGKFYFLPGGQYRLKMTKVPEGYKAPTEPKSITIVAKGFDTQGQAIPQEEEILLQADKTFKVVFSYSKQLYNADGTTAGTQEKFIDEDQEYVLTFENIALDAEGLPTKEALKTINEGIREEIFTDRRWARAKELAGMTDEYTFYNYEPQQLTADDFRKAQAEGKDSFSVTIYYYKMQNAGTEVGKIVVHPAKMDENPFPEYVYSSPYIFENPYFNNEYASPQFSVWYTPKTPNQSPVESLQGNKTIDASHPKYVNPAYSTISGPGYFDIYYSEEQLLSHWRGKLTFNLHVVGEVMLPDGHIARQMLKVTEAQVNGVELPKEAYDAAWGNTPHFDIAESNRALYIHYRVEVPANMVSWGIGRITFRSEAVVTSSGNQIVFRQLTPFFAYQGNQAAVNYYFVDNFDYRKRIDQTDTRGIPMRSAGILSSTTGPSFKKMDSFDELATSESYISIFAPDEDAGFRNFVATNVRAKSLDPLAEYLAGLDQSEETTAAFKANLNKTLKNLNVPSSGYGDIAYRHYFQEIFKARPAPDDDSGSNLFINRQQIQRIVMDYLFSNGNQEAQKLDRDSFDAWIAWLEKTKEFITGEIDIQTYSWNEYNQWYEIPPASYYHYWNWTNMVRNPENLRPSYEDLKTKPVNGYAFVEDDIDLPVTDRDIQGNVFDLPTNRPYEVSIGTPDGGKTWSHDKYYYLTFRPLPGRVNFVKTDKDGKPVEGAHFAIYMQDDRGQYQRIAENIDFVTDANGRIANLNPESYNTYMAYQQIAAGKTESAMAASKDTLIEYDDSLQSGLRYYLDNGKVFLLPGQYKLEEIIAPAEYMPLADTVYEFALDSLRLSDEDFDQVKTLYEKKRQFKFEKGETADSVQAQMDDIFNKPLAALSAENATKMENLESPGILDFSKTDTSGSPLEGAKFKLYKKGQDGKFYQIAEDRVFVTNADGHISAFELPAYTYKAFSDAVKKATLKGEAASDLRYYEGEGKIFLLPGTYRLEEIEAPKGYQTPNPAYQDFTIESARLSEEQFKQLIEVKNRLAKNAYTDPADKAQDEVLLESILNSTLKQIAHVSMTNELKQNYPVPFKFTKVDALSGAPLKDVQFDLYKGDPRKEGAEKINQDALVTGQDGVVHIGKVMPESGYRDLLKTDEAASYAKNGFFIREGILYLKPGSYYLQETKEQTGYSKLTMPVLIKLLPTEFPSSEADATEQDLGEIGNDKIYPVPLRLNKVDFFEAETKLAGATFDLYKGNDTSGTKIASDLSTNDQGILEIGESLTRAEYAALMASTEAKDAETNGYFTKDNKLYLMPGTYALVETKAPQGYQLPKRPLTVVTLNAIQFTDHTEPKGIFQDVTVKNRPSYPVPFKLRKVDQDTEKVLPGAVFTLYRGKPEDANPTVVKAGLTIPVSGELAIGKQMRGFQYHELLLKPEAAEAQEKGFFTVDDILYLMPGDYYLEETKAPIGYKLLNKKISFTLTETRFSQSGYAMWQKQKVTNERKYPVPFRFKKVDAFDKSPIQGSKFKIYRDKPTFDDPRQSPDQYTIAVATSDEQGYVSVGSPKTKAEYQQIMDNLDEKQLDRWQKEGYFKHEGVTYILPGTYYYKESEAARGYVLNEKLYSFEVPEVEFDKDGMAQWREANDPVENKMILPYPVRLTKKDEHNPEKKLPGAKFQLEALITKQTGPNSTYTGWFKVEEFGLRETDQDGTLKLGELKTEAEYREMMRKVTDEELKQGWFFVDNEIYLIPGHQFRLREMEAPKGYFYKYDEAHPELSLVKFDVETVTFDADGKAVYKELERTNPRIFPAPFKFTKLYQRVKADNMSQVEYEQKLAGVEFALYKGTPENGKAVEANKIAEGLKTDANGEIVLGPQKTKAELTKVMDEVAQETIDEQGWFKTKAGDYYLMPGSYYLVETKHLIGYEPLEGPILFKLTKPYFEKPGDANSLARVQTAQAKNNRIYPSPIRFLKYDVVSRKGLEGVTFDFYKGKPTDENPLKLREGLTTDEKGFIYLGDYKERLMKDYDEILEKLYKDKSEEELKKIYEEDGYFEQDGKLYFFSGDYFFRETSTLPLYKEPKTKDFKLQIRHGFTNTKVNYSEASASNEMRYPVPFKLKKVLGYKSDNVWQRDAGKATFELYKGDSVDEKNLIIKELATDAEYSTVRVGLLHTKKEFAELYEKNPEAKTDALNKGWFKVTEEVDGKSQEVTYLMPGKYTLVETEAPASYFHLLQDPFTFELKESDYDYKGNKCRAVEVGNDFKVPMPLQVTKSDEHNHRGLEGAKFELYWVKPGDDGTTLNPRDELGLRSDAMITDREGKLTFGEEKTLDYIMKQLNSQNWKWIMGLYQRYHRVVFDKPALNPWGLRVYIMPGHYVLKEVEAPIGYYLNEEPISFELKDQTLGNKDPNFVVTYQHVKMTNERIYPTPFKLTKVDRNNEPRTLQGAQFSLYKGEPDGTNSLVAEGLTTNDKGELVIGESLGKDGYDEVLDKALSEQEDKSKIYTDGYFTVNGKLYLFPGKFYLVETKAPTGYEALSDPIPFELVKTGFDDKGMGIYQTAQIGNQAINPVPFKLTKSDANNADKKLQGAVFTLYKGKQNDALKKEIKTGLTTDEKGILTIGKALTQAQYAALLATDEAKDAMKNGYFTAADGTLYLMPGDYHLVETTAPVGYELDQNNPPTVEFTLGKYAFEGETLSPVVEMELTNERINPVPFKLMKVDANNKDKKLAGAVFTLYRGTPKGEHSEVKAGLTTDANGEIVVGEALTKEAYTNLLDQKGAEDAIKNGYFMVDGKLYLMPGEYYVEETTAPAGYEKLTEPVKFTLTTTQFAQDDKKLAIFQEQTVMDERINPVPFKLTKVDANNNDKKLAGTVFTLYRGKPEGDHVEVKTGLTTDANGEIVVGEALTKEAYTKLLDQEGAKDALKNGYFTVDGKLYLMPGEYYVEETTVPAGYESLTEPVTFTLTTTQFAQDDQKLAIFQEQIVRDERINPVPFKLIKVDANNEDKKLEGAVFTLYRGTPKGEHVEVKTGLTTNNKGEIVVGEALTKAAYTKLLDQKGAEEAIKNGYFTVDDKLYLMPGDYYVVETAAPKGYELSSEPVKFTLTTTQFAQDETKLAIFQEQTVTDERINPVPFKLTKLDANNLTKKLVGAVFTLYRGKPDGEHVEVKTGLTTDNKGEIVVGEALTKAAYTKLLDQKGAEKAIEDGYFTVDGKLYLMPGEFYVVETAAPKGYELLTEPITFTLTTTQFAADAEHLAIFQEQTVKDERINPVPFKLTKFDANNDSKKLEGAIFTLYRGTPDGEHQEVWKGLTTDANGELVIGTAMNKADYTQLLDQPGAEKAMDDGYFTVDGKLYLMPGDFYLEETVAPLGYEKLGKPLKFTLKTTQFAEDDPKIALFQEQTVQDERINPVPFRLIKVDSFDAKKKLEGAVFTLYRGKPDGQYREVKADLKTNEQGEIVIGEAMTKADYTKLLDQKGAENAAKFGFFTVDGKLYLLPGDYFVLETTAPVGYELQTKPIAFTLSSTQFSDDEAKLAIFQEQTIQDERINPVPFKLTKVDSANESKKLKGAVFTLYRGTPGGEHSVVKADLTTDAAGEIMVGEALSKEDYAKLLEKDGAKDAVKNGYFEVDGKLYLLPGDFYMVETTAPAGYQLDAEPKLVTLERTVFDEAGKAVVVELVMKNTAKPGGPGYIKPRIPHEPMPVLKPTPPPRPQKLPKTGEAHTANTMLVLLLLMTAIVVIGRRRLGGQ